MAPQQTEYMKRIGEARKTLSRIGTHLIADKRSLASTGPFDNYDKGRGYPLGRDLLSVLIQANVAAPDYGRLDDEEILSRKSRFISFTIHSEDFMYHRDTNIRARGT